MSRLKILVLGGTRYFGIRLVEHLINSGHEVTILTRGTKPSPFANRIRHHYADRGNEQELRRAVGAELWDIVYDQSGYDPRHVAISSRVLGDNVGHYVYTSSQAVYASFGLLSENHFSPASHTDHSSENYANAKRLSESILCQCPGLPVTFVRFPAVIGLEDYLERLQHYVRCSWKNEPVAVANPHGWFSLISAEEAATALAQFVYLPPSGAVNVASKQATTVAAIAQEVSSSTHRPLQLILGSTLSPLERNKTQVLDTSKAEALGLTVSPIHQWLPNLVADMSERLKALA